MAERQSSRHLDREAAELVEQYGTAAKAARETGLAERTLRERATRYKARMDGLADEEEVEYPEFPPDDRPVEEILDAMAARQRQRADNAAALHWFPLKMKKAEPIGVAFVGDPHLGNNGTNIDLVRRDVDLMANTPGVYAVNMGDTVDNWGGRLIRVYAENDVSRSTEQKLARWFLQDSGIRWLLWLLGNHDEMDSGFAAYLRGIKAKQLPLVEWSAKFRLCFPNGCEVRVDAAHNHKGHSMWNNLHGQFRASRFDEEADIYIAGHHHDWGVAVNEPYPGRVVHMARARGYKFNDHYAHKHQFHEQQFGSTVLAVIDPRQEKAVSRIRLFPDLEEGCEFLTWKRQQSAPKPISASSATRSTGS